MPKVREGETRGVWMKRCVPVLINEGASQKQAVAVCGQMWKDRHRKESTMKQGEWVLYQGTLHVFGGKITRGKARLYRLDDYSGAGLKSITVPFDDVEEYKAPGGVVRGVEIFRTGTWNGDKYTLRDLQDMVDAFEEVGFRPPVKLGHAEKSGAPAFGWVAGLRLEGDRLIADFENVPEDVIAMIRERRFGSVSSEIFWNLERGGKKFRRVLKAVALLGAETPGVGDLRPLFEAQFSGDSYTRVVQHTVTERHTMRTVAEIKAALEKATDADEIKTLTAELEKAVIREHKAKEEEDDPDTEDRIKRLEQENAALAKKYQDAEVRRFTDDITIPSLRPFAEELYRLSMDDKRTVMFSTGEGDPQKVTMQKIVEDLFQQIGKLADKNLFTELAANDPANDTRQTANAKTPTQAGEALDKMARERAAKDKIEYQDAFDLVTEENPQLAKLYAQA